MASHNSLHTLQSALNTQIRTHRLNLYATCSDASAAAPGSSVSTLQFGRAADQAQAVARMMGCDARTALSPDHHAVIEVRHVDHQLVIELVIAPSAWWDQQNFVGKLQAERYCREFGNLLRRLGGNFRLGFWDGLHLNNMHLVTGEIANQAILNAWMSTFVEGQDWLRCGVWYDENDPRLEGENFVAEIFARIRDLYQVYNFAAWSGDNDFTAAYRRAAQVAV
jgi:hypothetical protein